MEKQDNYSAAPPMATFAEVLQFHGDSSHVLDHHQHKTHDDHRIDDYFPDQSCQENMISSNEVTTTAATATPCDNTNKSGKRKRGRVVKTSQEVECQRMTHIAVERNRRKQMNDHIRVLQTLMPTSYVQRGDQASIIGGAIEFVRELEQLLECLESQKRRRLYGESACDTFPNNQSFDPNNDETIDRLMMSMASNVGPSHGLAGLEEETAENKSAIANIEVKVSGLDAIIKILSRRRHGQLVKVISGLQELQFTILHSNISTVEETVVYCFTVKIGGETRLSAEDIASWVQQIFGFINAKSN